MNIMNYTSTAKADVSELAKSSSNSLITLGGIDDGRNCDLIAEFILNKYPTEHTQKGIVADLRQLNLWQRRFRGLSARAGAVPAAPRGTRLQNRVDQSQTLLPKSFLPLSA